MIFRIKIILIICFVSFKLSYSSQTLKHEELLNHYVNQYCIDCHGPKKNKGDIRLDNYFTKSKLVKEAILEKLEEQTVLNLMPPESEDQPNESERQSLLQFLDAEYKHLGVKSKFKSKIRHPEYGNYVNHDKLFSGEIKAMPFSPSRRWLISPYIFKHKVNNIIGNRRSYTLPEGIVNPFQLPDIIGIQYYDTESISGGHFQTMISNVKVMSYKQLKVIPQEVIDQQKDANQKYNQKLKQLNERKDLSEKDKKKALSALQRTRGANRVYAYKPNTFNNPENPFHRLIKKKGSLTDTDIEAAVQHQFNIALKRKPNAIELKHYVSLTKALIEKAGRIEGLRNMLVRVYLESEFLYRYEFGAGEKDEFGRKMLSPRELSYAIAYALTDQEPDETLRRAAASGNLQTREDVKREVTRYLIRKQAPEYIDQRLHTRHTTSYSSNQIKKLRFFREFFGYAKAYQVFKDGKRFEGGRPQQVIMSLIYDTDLMVDKILKKDRDVFNELLTTEHFYVYHNGNNELTLKAAQEKKAIQLKLLNQNWSENPKKFAHNKKKELNAAFGKVPRDVEAFLTKNKKLLSDANYYPAVYPKVRRGRTGADRNKGRARMFNIDHYDWNFPPEQPFKIPHRKGMLTHPAWLIAHSLNTSTDPVRRGKWVREKLLAGYVPDVPITVDAAIPEDHNKTLRQRIDSVTQNKACYKCHKKMNPLGYPFEMFDDFGRFRKAEELEYPEHIIEKRPDKGRKTRHVYKTLALNTKGYLKGSGDEALDGEVKDALDLIDRLAQSDRVRQSIIRHVFRYYLGRNELLSDSKTLIDADKAYLESGGSFDALVLSLLTSDSFLYRKDI